ncbi:MAG: hypothetical protein ACRDQZ_00190 [Mycobacteriales bacterium]
MEYRIRLGREMKLDQLTLALMFGVLGVGLLVLGVVVDWSGWLGLTARVIVIVLGVLCCLLDALRLADWRTITWQRSLLVNQTEIADDTKKGTAFRVRWSKLAAVGVVDDPNTVDLLGTRLILFPRAGGLTGPFHPLTDYLPSAPATPLAVRLPRQAAIAAALSGAAPQSWRRSGDSGWKALLTAPDAAPVAEPPASDSVTVDAGTSLSWQGILGGALALFLGIAAFVGAFGPDGATIGKRAALLGVGSPFLLIGVVILLNLPMLLRRRYVVVDAAGLIWDDPAVFPFSVAWSDVAEVRMDTATIHNYNSGDLNAVHLVLTPVAHDFPAHHKQMAPYSDDHGNYVLNLGDQPEARDEIGQAVQRFAPQLWRGQTERSRRIGLT